MVPLGMRVGNAVESALSRLGFPIVFRLSKLVPQTAQHGVKQKEKARQNLVMQASVSERSNDEVLTQPARRRRAGNYVRTAKEKITCPPLAGKRASPYHRQDARLRRALTVARLARLSDPPR